MNKPTILITGSNGMLGHKLVQKLKSKFNLIALNRKPDPSDGIFESINADINNFDLIADVLERIKPDYIVHTAAMVDIEHCENNKNDCLRTNFDAVKNMIDNILDTTVFIFISTESVFNLSKHRPIEKDSKNPPNYYCYTKSISEDYIIKHHSNHIIIRTNMYGFHSNWRGSIVEWAINNLSSNIPFGGYTDVTFNPLYTAQIADNIEELINLDFRGIIHLGSNINITKYEFLKKLSIGLGFPEQLICPTSIDDFASAKRTKYAVLDIELAQSILPGDNFDFEIGFNRMLVDLRIKNEEDKYW